MQAAEALCPELAARAAEAEAGRRQPADLAGKLAAAGLFRMLIPGDIGGLECAPADIVAVLERLARADASAGWCTMIAATTAYQSGFLDKAVAREIYGPTDGIYGGVFAPMGRATVVSGGYRVTGRWAWASGSANCTWLSGGCQIVEDGDVRTLPGGIPDSRMLLFPAAEVELIDTWQVAGLAGTGSSDMAVKDLFVPAAHSVSLLNDKATAEGPLYQFPTFGLLALGIAAVAIGNARAAIDDLRALAAAKTPQGSRRALAQRGQAQSETARAEASLRSARAFLFEAVDTAWQAVGTGAGIPVPVRAELRLAATHATRTAADVTRAMYDLGGGSALFLTSPLQRRFRDAHAMTQHMMVAPPSYELTGRVLLDLETDATFL